MSMCDSIIKDLEEKIAHRRLVKELRAEIAILNERLSHHTDDWQYLSKQQISDAQKRLNVTRSNFIDNIDIKKTLTQQLRENDVSELKVSEWVPYGAKGSDEENTIGGCGGFFENGMRWEDYISQVESNAEHYEVLRQEIIRLHITFKAPFHQSNAGGAPLFSDGKIGEFSYRAWGDLLAAVWSTERGKDYCYMDFYM